MTHLNKKLLVSLLDLAQADRAANVQSLAVSLNMSRREVASALNELAEAGLVRAETVRLTFVGLMRASGLRAQRVNQSVAA